MAWNTDICLLDYIVNPKRLAEKMHCVNFWKFDGQVVPPEKQVEAAAAEEQQEHKNR